MSNITSPSSELRQYGIQFDPQPRSLLYFWQIAIPLNLHRGWEGEKGSLVRSHVHGNPTRA